MKKFTPAQLIQRYEAFQGRPSTHEERQSLTDYANGRTATAIAHRLSTGGPLAFLNEPNDSPAPARPHVAGILEQARGEAAKTSTAATLDRAFAASKGFLSPAPMLPDTPHTHNDIKNVGRWLGNLAKGPARIARDSVILGQQAGDKIADVASDIPHPSRLLRRAEKAFSGEGMQHLQHVLAPVAGEYKKNYGSLAGFGNHVFEDPLAVYLDFSAASAGVGKVAKLAGKVAGKAGVEGAEAASAAAETPRSRGPVETVLANAKKKALANPNVERAAQGFSNAAKRGSARGSVEDALNAGKAVADAEFQARAMQAREAFKDMSEASKTKVRQILEGELSADTPMTPVEHRAYKYAHDVANEGVEHVKKINPNFTDEAAARRRYAPMAQKITGKPVVHPDTQAAIDALMSGRNPNLPGQPVDPEDPFVTQPPPGDLQHARDLPGGRTPELVHGPATEGVNPRSAVKPEMPAGAVNGPANQLADAAHAKIAEAKAGNGAALPPGADPFVTPGAGAPAPTPPAAPEPAAVAPVEAATDWQAKAAKIAARKPRAKARFIPPEVNDPELAHPGAVQARSLLDAKPGDAYHIIGKDGEPTPVPVPTVDVSGTTGEEGSSDAGVSAFHDFMDQYGVGGEHNYTPRSEVLSGVPKGRRTIINGTEHEMFDTHIPRSEVVAAIRNYNKLNPSVDDEQAMYYAALAEREAAGLGAEHFDGLDYGGLESEHGTDAADTATRSVGGETHGPDEALAGNGRDTGNGNVPPILQASGGNAESPSFSEVGPGASAPLDMFGNPIPESTPTPSAKPPAAAPSPLFEGDVNTRQATGQAGGMFPDEPVGGIPKGKRYTGPVRQDPVFAEVKRRAMERGSFHPDAFARMGVDPKRGGNILNALAEDGMLRPAAPGEAWTAKGATSPAPDAIPGVTDAPAPSSTPAPETGTTPPPAPVDETKALPPDVEAYVSQQPKIRQGYARDYHAYLEGGMNPADEPVRPDGMSSNVAAKVRGDVEGMHASLNPNPGPIDALATGPEGDVPPSEQGPQSPADPSMQGPQYYPHTPEGMTPRVGRLMAPQKVLQGADAPLPPYAKSMEAGDSFDPDPLNAYLNHAAQRATYEGNMAALDALDKAAEPVALGADGQPVLKPGHVLMNPTRYRGAMGLGTETPDDLFPPDGAAVDAKGPLKQIHQSARDRFLAMQKDAAQPRPGPVGKAYDSYIGADKKVRLAMNPYWPVMHAKGDLARMLISNSIPDLARGGLRYLNRDWRQAVPESVDMGGFRMDDPAGKGVPGYATAEETGQNTARTVAGKAGRALDFLPRAGFANARGLQGVRRSVQYLANIPPKVKLLETAGESPENGVAGAVEKSIPPEAHAAALKSTNDVLGDPNHYGYFPALDYLPGDVNQWFRGTARKRIFPYAAYGMDTARFGAWALRHRPAGVLAYATAGKVADEANRKQWQDLGLDRDKQPRWIQEREPVSKDAEGNVTVKNAGHSDPFSPIASGVSDPLGYVAGQVASPARSFAEWAANHNFMTHQQIYHGPKFDGSPPVMGDKGWPSLPGLLYQNAPGREYLDATYPYQQMPDSAPWDRKPKVRGGQPVKKVPGAVLRHALTGQSTLTVKGK